MLISLFLYGLQGAFSSSSPANASHGPQSRVLIAGEGGEKEGAATGPGPKSLDTEAGSCDRALTPRGRWLTCTFFRATVFLSSRQVALYTSLNCPRPIFFSIWKSASEQRKDRVFGCLWRRDRGHQRPPGCSEGPGPWQREPPTEPGDPPSSSKVKEGL